MSSAIVYYDSDNLFPSPNNLASTFNTLLYMCGEHKQTIPFS